jgi:hypothetical protein
MKFADIPQFTQARYAVDVSVDDIPRQLERFRVEYGLQDNPDFQRAHVWTKEKQERFVEFILRGGITGRDIYFNHPGWMRSFKGDFVLVDGKQRLEAIRRFLQNEIQSFGCYYSEFEDRIRLASTIKFHIHNLQTRSEVLQWYLDLNDGGVVHTKEELDKVRGLLEEER